MANCRQWSCLFSVVTFLWFHTVTHFIFAPFSCIAWYCVAHTTKSNFQRSKWFYWNSEPCHLYPLIRVDIRKSIQKFVMPQWPMRIFPFIRLIGWRISIGTEQKRSEYSFSAFEVLLNTSYAIGISPAVKQFGAIE